MSQAGAPVVDIASIVIFPHAPVESPQRVDDLWRRVFSSEPEKVEAFPARSTATALGALEQYGFAILQTAVSVQFIIGAPGATPAPPGLSGPERFTFDELLGRLNPIVEAFVAQAGPIARLGVHTRRVDSLPTRDEANVRALDLAGLQGNVAGSTDMAIQLNRQSQASIEGADLTFNLLRQIAVTNVLSGKLVIEASQGSRPAELVSEWEVLMALDCNIAPSKYAFTDQTPVEILRALISHMRNDVS